MNKKSFVLYQDQEEIVEKMSDKQAGKLFKAIFKYSRGEEPQLTPSLSLIFIPIRQALERDYEKWENIVKRNRENIKKRWDGKIIASEDTKDTSGISGIPNTLDNDNDNDNDNDKYNKKTSNISNKNISYLENTPLEDVVQFTKRFNITAPQVKSKAEDLLNYCKAKGKTYSDYKAFLSNALKKDFGIKLENVSSLGYKKYEKSN